MTNYGIIGLGRVGSLVARTLAGNGHEVSWLDSAVDAAPPGTGRQASIEDVVACDVIVECVTEDRDTKVAVLHALAGTSAAVLTTTSSFTVADLAGAAGLGDRLAGFHFLASYDGKVVELVTVGSGAGVPEAAHALAAELGLAPMEVTDRPGRISRRLLVPFTENVLRAVDLGIAPPDDIDRIVELGLGHAVGPLRRLAASGPEDHRAAATALSPSINRTAEAHPEGSR